MSQRSGEETSKDLLVSFLYILMRDHLPVGEIERIMEEHVEGKENSIFTNGWLAKYAKDVASRLKKV